MRPTVRRNIDYTSHSSKTVQGTEVRVSAGLRKGVFVNRARVALRYHGAGRGVGRGSGVGRGRGTAGRTTSN